MRCCICGAAIMTGQPAMQDNMTGVLYCPRHSEYFYSLKDPSSFSSCYKCGFKYSDAYSEFVRGTTATCPSCGASLKSRTTLAAEDTASADSSPKTPHFPKMPGDIKGTIVAASQGNPDIQPLLVQIQQLNQSATKMQAGLRNILSTEEIQGVLSRPTVVSEEFKTGMLELLEKRRQVDLDLAATLLAATALRRRCAAMIAVASNSHDIESIVDWLSAENVDAVLASPQKNNLPQKNKWWRVWK